MQYKLRTSPLQFVNPELPLSLDHQKQPAAHEFDLMGETPNCLERLAKSSLKNLLRVISSKVDLFRQITTAQFSVLPTHIKAAVTPIYIPIDPTIVIDGVASFGRQIEAEWVDYSPNNKERVVLFVHGGGFVCTSRKTHRVLTWRISKYAHARVLCTGIDYRLAPKHTYPVPLQDVLCAYRFLLKQFSASQISIVGDSAGGTLAVAAMLHCRNSPDFPMPGAIGGLCPWLDLTHSLPSWHLNRKECILPDASNDPIYTTPMRSHLYVDHNRQLVLPSVSPIFAAETTPICPVMLHIGACDRLRDDSLYFATQTFTNSPIGVEIYQGRAHVFQLFAPFSEFSKTSLKRLGSFLHEQTGRQTKRSVFEARTLFVSNSSGFPISEVDANAILVAGIAQLIRDGTWVLGNEGEIVKSVQVGHAKF